MFGMIDAATERGLIEAAVSGDGASAEQLLLAYFTAIERHIAPKIPASVRRQLGVEDVLQDTFAQAFRDIKSFDTDAGCSFLAWLKGIADHRLADAIKRIRRKKRGGDMQQLTHNPAARLSAIGPLVDLVCQDSNFPSRIAAGDEAARAMQLAIAQLADDQREMIRARYFDGLSVADIASQRGRTQGAVRGLLHRAKDNLRVLMGRSSRWLSSR